MSTEELRIPKKRQEVTLWVHPEGRVIGSLFLHLSREGGSGEEAPIDVLNEEAPFLVVLLQDPGEPRFYNKQSIVRVEHDGATLSGQPEIGLTRIRCRLQMMDGSYMEGTIEEALPEERSRLFDYLNQGSARFLKVHLGQDGVCLVNKSYVVHVTELGT